LHQNFKGELMKRVSVIGVGRLGICFALTLERAGYEVLGVDLFPGYVKQINDKTLESDEENVEEYLQASKNFRATTDLKEAVDFSDILFIVVATPSLENGRYDHSQVDFIVDSMISYNLGADKDKQFIICCTTMPGYCDSVQHRFNDYEYNFTVSYNPEFIAQGTILRDQAFPDTVLIGEGSPEAGDVLQEMYEKMTLNEPNINRMSKIEAEITKIGLNCFLTTKISYANMIGDIVSKAGGSPKAVLSAIGADSRIGNKYINYGYGYGGPCFPRDNRVLALYAQDLNIDALISIASDQTNEQHLRFQIEEFVKSNDKSKIVNLKRVTYKPESTLLVESQQLAFAVGIAEQGFKVNIEERAVVIEQLKQIHGDLFTYKVEKSS